MEPDQLLLSDYKQHPMRLFFGILQEHVSHEQHNLKQYYILVEIYLYRGGLELLTNDLLLVPLVRFLVKHQAVKALQCVLL